MLKLPRKVCAQVSPCLVIYALWKQSRVIGTHRHLARLPSMIDARHLVQPLPYRHGEFVAERVLGEVVEGHRPHRDTQAQHLALGQLGKALPG